MAELVDSEGTRVRFDAKAVTAVADHDDMGSPGTFVYGVLETAQKIAESPGHFLARLAIETNFVEFNRSGGTRIWINVGAVDYLRDRLPTDVPAIKSVIGFGGQSQGIAQDYDTATAALNTAGGKF